MKIIQCEQGSAEWLQARVGKVTASEMDSLVTPLYSKRKGEGVKTYLYQKVCEKLLNSPQETGGTWEMEQGKIGETLAIPWLEFAHGLTVERVGFCLADDGRCGCSPDGLIGDDSGVEVKCPQPAKHIAYLDVGEIPKEYRLQVQMCMYVTKRTSWRFVSYSPFLPPLHLIVQRDPEAQAVIDETLSEFYQEFDKVYNKVQSLIPKQRGRPD